MLETWVFLPTRRRDTDEAQRRQGLGDPARIPQVPNKKTLARVWDVAQEISEFTRTIWTRKRIEKKLRGRKRG